VPAGVAGELAERARPGPSQPTCRPVSISPDARLGFQLTGRQVGTVSIGIDDSGATAWTSNSEEDIVRSLVEDYFGQIDALITWARTQPRTAPTRREITRRYVARVLSPVERLRSVIVSRRTLRRPAGHPADTLPVVNWDN
jgi:hypothetical protein